MPHGMRPRIHEALVALGGVQEVLQDMLRELDGEGASTTETGYWSTGMARAWWALLEPYPAARTLLKMLARFPDEWVSFADVQEVSGRDPEQGRSDFAGATRQLRRIDPGQHPRWPYETKQVTELNYKTGYRMPAAIAAVFRPVVEEAS
jgi:hypothetical protein